MASTALIREAEIKDLPIIHDFIIKLARYENLENEVVASHEILQENLFGSVARAHVLILEEKQNNNDNQNKAIGFAIYFYTFSTFVGRPGIYIEDLYVDEPHRRKGYGTKLIKHICKIAKEQQCGRVEWSCLKHNYPALNFYNSIGAKELSAWTGLRLTEKAISDLSF